MSMKLKTVIEKIVSSKDEGKWETFMTLFDGRKEEEEFLQDINAQVNKIYSRHLKTSLLHQTIRNWGFLPSIENLIKLGANPLADEANGDTPLHVAVHVSASDEIIKALLLTQHQYNNECTEDPGCCQCGLLALKVRNLKQQCPKDIKPIAERVLQCLKSQELLFAIKSRKPLPKIYKLVKDQKVTNFSADLPRVILDTIIDLEKEDPDENDNIYLVIAMLSNFFCIDVVRDKISVPLMKFPSENPERFPAARYKWKSYFMLFGLLSIKSERKDDNDFLLKWAGEEFSPRLPECSSEQDQERAKDNLKKFRNQKKNVAYLIAVASSSSQQRTPVVQRIICALLKQYHKISNPEDQNKCPIDWSGLSLKEISIHNKLFMDISNRDTLYLSNNMLTKCPLFTPPVNGFKWLVNLRRLKLSHNKIEKVPKELFDIQSLQELTLSHNHLKELPKEIKFSENFRSLYLSHNHLRSLPNSFTKSSIRTLDISYNDFEILPDCVCEMKKLRDLTLDGNKGILEFPVKLGQFGLETVVSCNDMDQLCYPAQIYEDSKTLLNHLRMKLYKSLRNTHMNLMVVGPPGHGKTALLHRILPSSVARAHHNGQNNGVKFYPMWEFSEGPSLRKYQLKPVDFPGNIEFSSTQCFLTKHTLYLVVWDVTEPVEELKEWLNCLVTYASGSVVVFVGTHPSHDTNAKVYEDRLNRFLKQNENSHFIENLNFGVPNPKYNIGQHWFYRFDANKHSDTKTLRKIIKQVARNVLSSVDRNVKIGKRLDYKKKILGDKYPQFYFQLLEIIERKKKEGLHLLPQTEFQDELDQKVNDLQKSYSCTGDESLSLHPRDVKEAVAFLKNTGHLLQLDDNTTTWCFIDLDWLNDRVLCALTKQSLGNLLTMVDVKNLLHDVQLKDEIILAFIKSFNIGFQVDDKIQLAKLMGDVDGNNGRPTADYQRYKVNNRFFRIHVFKNNYVPFGFWVKLISTLFLHLERLVTVNNSVAYDMYQIALRSHESGGDIGRLSGKARYWKRGFVYEDCKEEVFFSVIQDPKRQWLVNHLDLRGRHVIQCEVITADASRSAKLLVMLVNHINTVLEEVFRMTLNFGVEEYSPCTSCLMSRRELPVTIFPIQECFEKYGENGYDADTLRECNSGHVIELRRLFPEFMYDDCPDLILSHCHNFGRFHEDLGSGGCGTVKLGTLRCHGTNRPLDDTEVKPLVIAVKFLKESNEELDARKFLEFKKEAMMLLDASDHSNVVTMYGVRLDTPFPLQDTSSPASLVQPTRVRKHLALVMENAEKGSLSGQIHRGEHFGRVLLYRIAYQIADGLAYLHYLQVVHRDIKPGNILLLSDSIFRDINVKIADFDTACFENPENYFQGVGTDGYKAPDYYQSLGYNCSVDVWAFGIVLFELLTLQIPFRNTDSLFIKDRVLDGKTPLDGCSVEPRRDGYCLQMLMKECWKFSASRRPKAKYLLYFLLNDCFQMLLFSYYCGANVKEVSSLVKCRDATKKFSVVVKSINHNFIIKEINPTKSFDEWQDTDLTSPSLKEQFKDVINIEFVNIIDTRKILTLVKYKKRQQDDANHFKFIAVKKPTPISVMREDGNVRDHGDEEEHFLQPTAKTICELENAHRVMKVQCNNEILVVQYVDSKTRAICMRKYKWPLSQDSVILTNRYNETMTQDSTDFFISTIVDRHNNSKNNNSNKEHSFLFISYTNIVNIYALLMESRHLEENPLHIDLSKYTARASSSNNRNKEEVSIKAIYMHWDYLIVTFSGKPDYLAIPLAVFQEANGNMKVVQRAQPIEVRAFDGGNISVTSFCSIFDTLWFGFDNGYMQVYTIKEEQHVSEAVKEEIINDLPSSNARAKLLKNIRAYSSPVESLLPVDYERPEHEPAAVVSYGKKLCQGAFDCNNAMTHPGGDPIKFNRKFLKPDDENEDKNAANDMLLFWHAEEARIMERLSMEQNVDEKKQRNENLNFLESHSEQCLDSRTNKRAGREGNCVAERFEDFMDSSCELLHDELESVQHRATIPNNEKREHLTVFYSYDKIKESPENFKVYKTVEVTSSNLSKNTPPVYRLRNRVYLILGKSYRLIHYFY